MQPVLTPAAKRALDSPVFRFALAPALVAWPVMLLAMAGDGSVDSLCLGPRANVAARFIDGVAAALSTIDPGRWTGEWGLMTAATMLPLASPMARHVAASSFAARRERTVALFVSGFAVAWLAAGAVGAIALVLGREALTFSSLAWASGPIGCGLAAAWQVSAAKTRAFNRCHGTKFLRPTGAAADWDAVAFGLVHGGRCIRACLPIMLLPLLGGHSAIAMPVIFALLLLERECRVPPFRLSALLLFMLGMTMIG